MTKKEELEIYRKALIDWEKTYQYGSYTNTGFCNYFLNIHGLNLYFKFKEIFPKLYSQREIRHEDRHYRRSGRDIVGRIKRVTALKNAIEILETQLKQNK